jgi:spore coat protein A, manganese oxidase
MVATDETVIVQPRFGPYPGRYVFHCHNLEHQEKAMMLQMEIA